MTDYQEKPNYPLYEIKKADLRELNLTPDEYEKAIEKISKECGI